MGALVLMSILIYSIAFCGCVDDKNNKNTLNATEFKVIPANKELFNEFASKSVNSYGHYYNIMYGVKLTIKSMPLLVYLKTMKLIR